MTVNQKRAHYLAIELLQNETIADRLTDFDWNLLLLAAGQNDAASRPSNLAHHIVDDYREHAGYFCPVKGFVGK